MSKTAVVVPNWNGKDSIQSCMNSLFAQSIKSYIVVVDNGSTDGSLELIKKNYPDVDLIINQNNLGFAGGVNQGVRRAIELGLDYVALFNDDAVADKSWLSFLVKSLEDNAQVGIATCKFMTIDRKRFDSTGDLYTIWGLPFPRGRGEPISPKYDNSTDIFAASGGSSIYRVKMLKQIGLFDKDFFAYYEDVDISFRAQLAGWKVKYVPSAIAYHHIGAASSRIKGFTTYQTMKNLPWVLIKNVPFKLMFKILPRFSLAYFGFILSAIQRHQTKYALKGLAVSIILFPKKLIQRIYIQSHRKVSIDYIKSIITYDLPPNATKLRNLRAKYHRIFK